MFLIILLLFSVVSSFSEASCLRASLVRLHASKFMYKNFDSNNVSHCSQLSELFNKNHEYLFDPHEKVVDVMQKYCTDLQSSSLAGLRILLATKKPDGSNQTGEKVLGAISYELRQVPVVNKYLGVRTLVVDDKYRNLGLAKTLLSFAEQEAVSLGFEKSLFCVYSHNHPMISFAQKHGYGCLFQDPRIAFTKIEGDVKNQVHARVYTKDLGLADHLTAVKK